MFVIVCSLTGQWKMIYKYIYMVLSVLVLFVIIFMVFAVAAVSTESAGVMCLVFKSATLVYGNLT